MSTRSSSLNGRGRVKWGLLCALASIIWSPAGIHAAPPQALWHVVHDLCLVDHRLTRLPAPCLEVNLADGYALVPDPNKHSHLLLVPTQHITGVEDPRLIEPGAPNYWQQAWEARRRLAARIGRELPRDQVGLGVNAISSRSQDQLHIHISCIHALTVDALQAVQSGLSQKWSAQKILGRRWQIRTIRGEDLGEVNPFHLVAVSNEAAARNMGDQIIVVLGAQFKTGPGFYILSRSADADGRGVSAEDMLDEDCSIPRTGREN